MGLVRAWRATTPVRSRQTNYLVTETNAQTIGWDSKEQFPPYDGQLRLDVYTHLSSGANMVEYWHWHSIHYGQETYWKGVLSHDLEPNRAYAEVSRTAHELQRIGPEIVDLKRISKVAILYSNDSYYGIEFMKFSDNVNYRTSCNRYTTRCTARMWPWTSFFRTAPTSPTTKSSSFRPLCCQRRTLEPAGGLRARRRPSCHGLQERIHQRVRHRPLDHGARSASQSRWIPLPGIF